MSSDSLFSVNTKLSSLHLQPSSSSLSSSSSRYEQPSPVLTTVNELTAHPRSISHHGLLSSYPSLHTPTLR